MTSAVEFDGLEDLETTERIISAGDEMAVSAGKIEEILQTANVDANAYNKALEAFSGAISLDDGKEVQSLIAKMMMQTQEMQQQNNRLREQLEQSSSEVQELRGNLELVKHEAMTDVLTDVGNRKYFDIKLRELTEKAMAAGEPVSLLLFDVDHFKAFNDTHGHQVGDQVLRLVARTLKESVKGRDIVARYGGEEFAVILSGAQLRDALKVGTGICELVAKRRMVRKSTGEKFAAITISAGVAHYCPGEPLSELIERSDAALYRAKDAGRNRVMPEAMPGKAA
jgi:diguanylate cyclase